jgi:hypothetical protein
VETEILRALEAHRPSILTHWESLLRLERASSPLAQPDLLVRMLDQTLDDIFAALPGWSIRRVSTLVPASACPCGRNPLLAYYAAGQQALREALVMIQAGISLLTTTDRDDSFACVDQVFGDIARREIEAFCALCQFRPGPAKASMPLARTSGDPVFRLGRMAMLALHN